ncbi:MAG: hypothetical protein NC483_02670 [Ruminococcus sp.]|nr:hypothetical protein [Ruminococcus sp.]
MNKEICPYCGGKEFVKAKHNGYGNVYPASKRITTKEQKLYHIICLDCGTVVRSFVKNPRKLETKKDKRDKI